jgi:hypothetical protein
LTSWVTRQQSPVLVEPCEDGHVVHLVASGMTHLVDSLTAELLTYLQDPREVEQVRQFVATLAGDPGLTITALESERLSPLEAIGLLERRT